LGNLPAVQRKDPDARALLTPREVEVLYLVGEGKSNAQIGSELGCATGTVKKHVYHIFKKLKVTNRICALNRFAGG
jgi:DNA-binding NarL/FixJ family response regulator